MPCWYNSCKNSQLLPPVTGDHHSVYLAVFTLIRFLLIPIGKTPACMNGRPLARSITSRMATNPISGFGQRHPWQPMGVGQNLHAREYLRNRMLQTMPHVWCESTDSKAWHFQGQTTSFQSGPIQLYNETRSLPAAESRKATVQHRLVCTAIF
jgi:hypothetical protein